MPPSIQIFQARMNRFVFLFLLTAPLAGCQLVGPSNEIVGGEGTFQGADREALAEARARWAASGLDDYTFTYSRVCFCALEWVGPFRITVRDGRVASATREGEPVDPAAVNLPTVPDLFAVIEDALDRDADRLAVTYDAVTGIPLDVDVDYSFGIADEEVQHLVSEVVTPQ